MPALPDIHSIGISIWDPIHAQREHVGTCWEIVHIISGSVKLHLGTKACRGAPGDTLLVPAGMPHRDEFPPGTDFEVLHIMFRWKQAKSFFPGTCNRRLIRLPEADKHRIRALAFETYDCFRRRRALWEAMTAACLLRLLLFIRSALRENEAPRRRQQEKTQHARRRRMIAEAKDYVLEHLDTPISLSDIAAHLDISPYHLSHLFSEESGFTLSSYLLNARMERAADLLADPNRRIADVAYAVGYEDPNYFGKVFRRHFGCPPGTFRARRG
jgi:AraC-like DNA-binding protein